MDAWILFNDENTFSIDFRKLHNWSSSGSWIRVSETEFVRIYSNADDNVKDPKSDWDLIRLKAEYNQIMKMNHFLFDQELKEIADPGSLDPATKKIESDLQKKIQIIRITNGAEDC